MYETPPVEKNGAQVELVYQDGKLVHTIRSWPSAKLAALAGRHMLRYLDSRLLAT